MVDYSSDKLESSDIWKMPGGWFLEQLVDFPRLGQNFVGAQGFMEVEAVTSPSDFLVLLPELLTVDPQVEYFSQRLDFLLGSSSWREKGAFFTQKLGFSDLLFRKGTRL